LCKFIRQAKRFYWEADINGASLLSSSEKKKKELLSLMNPAALRLSRNAEASFYYLYHI